MHQDRPSEQRALEVALILIVFGITCLYHVMPHHRMVVLHLYVLPVCLGGFYLGRNGSGMMALLAAICVAIVTMIGVHGATVEPLGQINMFALGVWAAVLGLTALLVGTLSDDRNRKIFELHESNRTNTLADELTGVANRRAFQYELSRRMTEWHRQETSLSMILVDIDHFKKFNDTYGHQAGDSVLREVARAIYAAVREVDLVARYGGEEFSVILPNTTLADAKEAAERVRSVIEASRFEYEGFKLRLTVSVGVAHVRAGEDSDSFIQRTDAALYASKEAGRNCAHFHDGTSCEHFGVSLPSPPAEADQTDESISSSTDVYTDGVTGLPTRKVFNEELRRRVAEAQRYDSHLSIMFVEVDDFASIDDRGPQAGDMVIAMTAEFTLAALRDSDLVARYAKDKFAVLLPATPLIDASIPSERLRQRVASYDELKYQKSPLRFSICIGLAELARDEDAHSLLQRVETALLTAQESGGNRLIVHNRGTCGPIVGEALVYESPPTEQPHAAENH